MSGRVETGERRGEEGEERRGWEGGEGVVELPVGSRRPNETSSKALLPNKS